MTRQMAHEPMGWRLTTSPVTVRRYTGCGHVWRPHTLDSDGPLLIEETPGGLRTWVLSTVPGRQRPVVTGINEKCAFGNPSGVVYGFHIGSPREP